MLDLPEACDVRTLCRRIAERPDRGGRPIHLLPMLLPSDAPAGMWVATTAADYIVYETGTTKPHQAHIIAHELGHLLLEHDSHQTLTDTAIEQLLPDIAPSKVRSTLCRGHYSATEEHEAEIWASLLLQQVSHWSNEPTFEVPEAVAHVIERLGRSLE